MDERAPASTVDLHEKKRKRTLLSISSYYIAGCLTAILIGCSISAWQSETGRESQRMEQALRFTATDIANNIRAAIHDRVQLLERLSYSSTVRSRPTPRQESLVLKKIQETYKDLEAVYWVDTNYSLMYPYSGPLPAQYLTAVEDSKKLRHGVLAGPFKSVSGIYQFCVIVPTIEGENVTGYLLGMLNRETLGPVLMANAPLKDVHVRLDFGNDNYYEPENSAAIDKNFSPVDLEILLNGAKWNLQASPGTEFTAKYQSYLSDTILIGGILFSLLFGLALLFMFSTILRSQELNALNSELEQRVLERTRELDKAIQNMQSEIRAREKMEKELALRAEALAASNEELEQFALVASHDLQEPLRKISSYGGLLQERYQGQLDEKGGKFIEYMVDGAQRMQTLIRDLLTYARVGKKDFTFEAVLLDQIVSEVISDLEPAIQEAGAHVDKVELPVVRGNRAQMRQLFQNLLSNSLKFRRDVPLRIRIGLIKDDDRWIITIQDNGIGIEPQHSDRIFQIFQRLHRREEYPGTGIGLAVCKKIVERHGGHIWVKSVKNEGSTFFLTLPLLKVDSSVSTESPDEMLPR